MRLNRRAFLRGVAVSMAAGVVGTTIVWRRYGTAQLADLTNWRGFSSADIELMSEIADTIIPPTATPGAKAAEVGSFMALAVTECYEPPLQSAFVAGLSVIDSESVDRHGRHFVELTPDQRVEVLSAIEGERRWRELWNRGQRGLRRVLAPVVGKVPSAPQIPHFMTLMMDLAVLGYFTSKVGATQALRHDPIPGNYDGALPYKKGDRAWSM